MNSRLLPRCWVVGGPPRCGKTTLVNSISRVSGSVIGLRVEGLLQNYLRRRGDPERILEEYLQRPRWMDGKRTISARPIDQFDSSLSDIAGPSAKVAATPVAAIANALDGLARNYGRTSWMVADVYPEFFYERLRTSIKGLNLAAVFRDPRESLCASIYWTTWPERAPNAYRLLRHNLILWCLSADICLRLRQKYPGEVTILNFNEMVDNSTKELEMAGALFDVSIGSWTSVLPEKPFFSYSGEGHYTPSGSVMELLTPQEIDMIETVCGQWMKKLGFPEISEKSEALKKRHARLIGRINLASLLARRYPAFVKGVVAEWLAPGRFFRHLKNKIKNFIKKLLGYA